MADIQTLIRQHAVARGLDPNAVLSVAAQEGLSGRVGDNGTSFGPFQLHQGGALPSNIPLSGAQAWASSPQGVDYALDRIKGVAGGLTGESAIRNIVTRFERPADPNKEIAGAISAFGSKQFGSSPIQHALDVPSASPSQPADRASQLVSWALANSNALLSGKQGLSAPVFNLDATPKVDNDPAVLTSGKVTRRVAGAVNLAKEYMGTPYVWGGSKPGGFDCSGLLQYVWAKQGVDIPRTTYDQFRQGAAVDKNQLKAGDAVFFTGSDPENGLPGHVGMYIGGGKFIEAPHTGSTVHISELSGRSDFVGARRYA